MKFSLNSVEHSWKWSLGVHDRDTDINQFLSGSSGGRPAGKSRLFESREEGLKAARSIGGFTEILLETYRGEYRRYWLRDDLVPQHLEDLRAAARRHTNRFPVVCEVRSNNTPIES